jgi:hypothetical protein
MFQVGERKKKKKVSHGNGSSLHVQSYVVALPAEGLVARDLPVVQVAVAPQKTAHAASVVVSEVRMLNMPLI